MAGEAPQSTGFRPDLVFFQVPLLLLQLVEPTLVTFSSAISVTGPKTWGKESCI